MKKPRQHYAGGASLLRFTKKQFDGRTKRQAKKGAVYKIYFYEQVTEHTFLSEILQEAWFRYSQQIEVLKSEIDAYGFDLVLECNGVLRHVQLKTSEKCAGRKQIVSLKLAKKSNWCVIWMLRDEDRDSKRMKLTYLFFGVTVAASRLNWIAPNLEDDSKYSVALNPRSKTPRQNSIEVHNKEFYPPISPTGALTITQLLNLLFGL